MDSTKDGKNFEPTPMDVVTNDDVNLCDDLKGAAKIANDVGAPKLTEIAVPSKLNDTTKHDYSEVVSNEEPPLKKFKATAAMPVRMCSYKPCNSAVSWYCFTCHCFYCKAHASIDAHECILYFTRVEEGQFKFQ